jgi:hypothetical protein
MAKPRASFQESAVSSREELELFVFSGAYAEVLARTADHYEPSKAPAVVGALALSGRMEEAESAFTSFLPQCPDQGDAVQARFFLAAGLCHAGKVSAALRRARESLGQVRAPEPRRRFWACQGLALVRFFEGHFRQSRRFARKALAAAVEGGFSYARFLALDLLAHVSLHTGEVFAGMRLLSQAEELARALGYADNAQNERTAALVFQLRLLLADVAIAVARVEEVVNAPEVSYFTRRNGLIELAGMFALSGDAARAARALEDARHIALPGSDSRARTRWLVCHALCEALAHGPEQARPSLEEARVAAGDQQTLLVEIGFVELVFTGERSEPALAAFAELGAKTGIQRARVALDLATGSHELFPPRVEDGLGRVLLECNGRPAVERVRRVVAAGLYGLVPWALERAPGRRVIVLEAGVLTENQGHVGVRELPNRTALKLLFALRTGYKSRAALLEEVWGIARFDPHRHTAVLHTAVSRLRVALAEPDWIATHDDGYALVEGVEVVTLGQAFESATSASVLPPPGDDERVLELVTRRGQVSSADVAEELRLSASTALRLLRRLAESGALRKSGSGRGTRYGRG